jgi:hypothetical protein
MIRVRSRITGSRFFWSRLETLPDIPEIHPVEEQVDDEQGGEYQAPVIVHGDPLVAGDAEIRSPAASPSTTFRENEKKHKPGHQGWDERYQAADIDQGIDSDASHEKHL